MQVFYAPDDPETAVLEPGWSVECWYQIFCPTLLFAIAIATAAGGVYSLWSAFAQS